MKQRDFPSSPDKLWQGCCRGSGVRKRKSLIKEKMHIMMAHKIHRVSRSRNPADQPHQASPGTIGISGTPGLANAGGPTVKKMSGRHF